MRSGSFHRLLFVGCLWLTVYPAVFLSWGFQMPEEKKKNLPYCFSGVSSFVKETEGKYHFQAFILQFIIIFISIKCNTPEHFPKDLCHIFIRERKKKQHLEKGRSIQRKIMKVIEIMNHWGSWQQFQASYWCEAGLEKCGTSCWWAVVLCSVWLKSCSSKLGRKLKHCFCWGMLLVLFRLRCENPCCQLGEFVTRSGNFLFSGLWENVGVGTHIF